MNQRNHRLVWGVILIGIGVLLLLQTLNLFHFVWGLLWAVLFAAGGAAFLVTFLARRDNWWAVIPAFALMAIASLISLGILFPQVSGRLGGMLFLSVIGLSFWLVYARDRQQWWAIIPGGVLMTLALIAGISNILPGIETGSVFFGGLALTFLMVYLLPSPQGRMGWAMIPAAICFALTLLITISSMASLFKFVWPVAAILGGVYLLYRALRPR